jgi:hypothetical protein
MNGKTGDVKTRKIQSDQTAAKIPVVDFVPLLG